MLSYKGTRYHGWQIQPNALTIQEVLTNDISTILGEKISLTGCGRTDAGVHARQYFAHFDTNRDNLEKDPHLIFKLNGKLPEDISIHKIYRVGNEDHARYSALSRTYEYHISRIKDPFLKEFSHYIYGELDFKSMNSASKLLLGTSDFTSFSRVDNESNSSICNVQHAIWDVKPERMIFTITADRFLRNMVRAIVGTLLEVGFGKISVQDFKNIIQEKDRSEAGTSAPAKGLFLTEIIYPPEIVLK